ncbi:hypothetical protein ACFU8W_34670 [Streptomyces sp. NPDC057565]|uniref:hypothetical protein n=1 Tax=Streptomyces sp. NPDC057565 TaxID=3346169 RepID=UPI0036BAC81A
MRALQANREQAIGPPVEVLAKRSALLEELAALEASYSKAYVDAEAAGWTPEELARLGPDEPVKRPRVRSRRKSSAAKMPAAQTSAVTPQTDSPAGAVPARGGPPTQRAPVATGVSVWSVASDEA